MCSGTYVTTMNEGMNMKKKKRRVWGGLRNRKRKRWRLCDYFII